MRILVTGSSGHLGEALVRTLRDGAHEVVSLDRKAGPFTHYVGTITDRDFVRDRVRGVDAVIHTATLHKPHIATHSRQAFVDTNITGTLNLLEEAATNGVRAFISKVAAEDLCELFHHRQQLACVVLRTARFFPEVDDDSSVRTAYADANLKANEYLYRRADLQDVVDAHRLALEKAPLIGFGRYIISATTPFQPDDLAELRTNAPRVVDRRVPEYATVYAGRGWRMFPSIDRVYVNERARRELGWQPKYDFRRVIRSLQNGEDPVSPLARAVGSKGYHDREFADGPYPVSWNHASGACEDTRAK